MEPWEEIGMTFEQWEVFQKWTNGFPNHDENGVDLSLLRANLKLTPEERIRKLERGARSLVEWRNATSAAILRDR